MGADKPMVKNGRSEADAFLCYAGCSCHNGKARRRSAKHSAKREEQRQWTNDVKDES